MLEIYDDINTGGYWLIIRYSKGQYHVYRYYEGYEDESWEELFSGNLKQCAQKVGETFIENAEYDMNL